MSSTNRFEAKVYTARAVVCALAAFAVFAVPGLLLAESASVSNTVSVSSDGGTSYSSIQTEINGKVVEDIESHESGTISSHTVVTGTTSETYSSSTITTNTTQSGDEEILRQIKELVALIQHYVSLLNAIS